MKSRSGNKGMNASEAFHPSAGTLVNLLPAVLPAAMRVSKTMNAPILVYNADGSLYAWASEQRLARLQSAGLVARVVRHRKGHINRVFLFLRPGEPKPLSASSVAGARYSFKELLEHGPAWKLKHLEGNANGKDPAHRRLDRSRVNGSLKAR